MIFTLIRAIKVLISFIIIFSAIGLTLLFILYFYFAYDLPNIQTLKDYKPPVVSEVFARNGTKIGEFWTECRFYLPVEEIPDSVINAFIAAEDSRFYEHRGVDILGIGRAFIENLKAGHVVQGGSTITQQITRSILLSSERKIARKVREAILATRLERNLNKKQILELYLNQIFLGNRAYGIKAAARNYFHKQLSELTLAETAMIAGMPTAPSQDSPVRDITKAKERQRVVLSRMYERNFITQDQQKSALVEPLTIYVAGTDKEYNYEYAPYFVEHVRRIVQEKYGDDVLYKSGLKIYTTADLHLNQTAQKALRHGLEALDKRQGWRGAIAHTDNIEKYADDVQKEIEGEYNKNIIHIPADKSSTMPPLDPDKFYKAIITGFKDKDAEILVGNTKGLMTAQTKFKIGDVVMVRLADESGHFSLAQIPRVQGALYSMNPHTGEVIAMAGGYDFATSEFNRATQALRQPGSSFKPFIYAAALDKGFRFGTQILDGPVVYQQGPYLPTWSPKNYGNKYSGLTTFESDLIHSRNVPTVKIANDIGLHYLTAYARKMGLTSGMDKYLSMALGANGVYLSEMVPAYSTFDTLGIKPTPVYITKIEDADGKILEETNISSAIKTAAVETNKDADSKNLNSALFEEAKKYIDEDKLILTQDELKILYGSAIPEGGTITPQTAYLMTKLLEGVVDRGTGTRVKALGRPVAGKTGTTNDETDCWFIGFVPDLAAGVWVGFDNIVKIGSMETGGKTAAPIFLEYMQEATKNMEAKKFEPPKGLNENRVASLTGGSAIYFKGYSLLRESLEGEHRQSDRAIDFFEEDMATSPDKPPALAKPSPSEEAEDNLEF